MKFAGNVFVMLSLASLMSLFQMDAMADCWKSAEKGKFCKGTLSHECRPGCYCIGGTGVGTGNGFSIEEACKNKSSSSDIIKKLQNAHVYYCPDDFPYSESGAKEAEDCFVEGKNLVNNRGFIQYERLYNKSITCPFGQYLPMGSDKCANCIKDTTINQYTCQGGTWKPSFNKDQGLKINGYEIAFSNSKSLGSFNLSNTTTATLSVKCSTGQYLPADLATCATCPDGYICPNAKTYTVSSVDQGAEKCPTGTTPNAGSTKCEQTANNTVTVVNTDNVKKWVDAGYYLPANSSKQRLCTTQKQYCPGGWFSKKNYDQGKYDCPYGEETSDHKSCHMKITQEQMRNGINGNSDCWLKINDSEDYKTCVFGKR